MAALLLTLPVAAQKAPSHDALLKQGDSLMSRLKYEDAYVAYRSARTSDDAAERVKAGTGMVRALLRLSLYAEAAREGAAVAERDGELAAAVSLHADTLWASGLFQEAEQRYQDALTLDPTDADALHGQGRALAAQRQYAPALAAVRRAIASNPRESAYHYTLASILEETRQYQDAASALDRYLILIPSRDESDMAKWAAAQSSFLRSFGDRIPLEVTSLQEEYVLPFRVENDRVLVTGRLNGDHEVEFALDTGADQTTITPAVAARAGIRPTLTMQTAGVGSLGVGFRTLQVARIDELAIGDLRIRNVPSLIKSPALTEIPRQEGAGFNPLALGFSVEVDYGRNVITMARELEPADFPTHLPMRMQRLATVRGMINGTTPVSFVLDTGGTALSVSRKVAGRLDVNPEIRQVPVRVYGTSGWDRTAFLFPYLDIELAPGVGTSQRSVVVLNLDAPSALLGYEMGGIIGHQFLRDYVVRIDLMRSEVSLRPIG
ncbi:MAG: aspartyl protease family protein [Acidobacteria bacterium]|nr:aspartyl protease family protein [Acidobacteriota bacterium]